MRAYHIAVFAVEHLRVAHLVRRVAHLFKHRHAHYNDFLLLFGRLVLVHVAEPHVCVALFTSVLQRASANPGQKAEMLGVWHKNRVVGAR